MPDQLPCPIDGCPRTRPSAHAMCRTHWAMVPPRLKSVVLRTWRRRLADPGDVDHREGHRQALTHARVAVHEALEARERRSAVAAERRARVHG